MASSYSTDLKLELMVTGENSGTWGDKTNTNLNLLDQAVAGYQNVVLTSTNTTLVMTNATVSNARNAVLKLTGTLSANSTVYVDTGITKPYLIDNQTTGAYTLALNQVGGASVIWGTTDKSLKSIYLNGIDAIDTGIVTLTGVQTITNKTLTSPTITTAATLNAQAELRLADADSSNYVGLKSGTTVNTNIVWTLPTADGTSGQFLKTNGSGVLSFGAASAITWQSVQTTNFTAVAGNGYPVNTTSAGITVTLPVSASTGDTIQIVDYAGTFATNNLTINPNGLKINSGTGNKILNTNREAITLTYIDSTQGWVLSSDSQITLPNGPYSIDFLVVAGGGAGGRWVGGGGGAGGYRTSTQPVTVGTAITVTVGDGGASATGSSSPSFGASGSNSSISGSGLTTITSSGGGGGGGYPPDSTGIAGGSGGGAGSNAVASASGGAGNTPSTSPSQGNNGGSNSTTNYACGGGGGAGAVGSNASGGTGGAGGAGTASSITGSSVTYAGGGGGHGATAGGAGGSGGGGAGGSGGPSNGTAGTANLGGGGGGSRDSGSSGAGGKGVVILSVPTASYSGTSSGSPTITTSGANTILQFNGSGSYTA